MNHLPAFQRFAQTMRIPSKDFGMIPFRLWNVQRHFVTEICKAIEREQREIVCLKARQIGATTVMMAWDAYWLLRHPGMQGQFNANADDNREYFRDVLQELYKSLPPQFSYPQRLSNKNVIAWANGSRLMFQTVGRSGKVGRGRGLSFSHSTEMGEWQNQEAIASLRAAFSERHQHALFIWEGTAKGYDVFYDMWQDAQKAVTIHPIFLAWWMHEDYRLRPTTQRQDKKIFDVYWDGRLTSDERAWQREITRHWQTELTAEQWAWRRWKVAEKMGDEILAAQEFPTLPEHAFQASGQPFVGHGTLGKLRERLDDAPPASHFRYAFGPTIEQLELAPTTEELAQLTLWEEPDPNAYYVVAADPAYGASATSDRYVCSVWRASRSRLVQVASFVTHEVTMNQFAWVTCHLAGAYSPSFFILELNGPGMAVHQEIERLKAMGWGTAERGKVLNALASIQAYIWRRPDGMGQGASWQWRTTPRTKIWILNRLRDQLMQDTVVVREPGLVHELGNVRQDGDRFRAEGRAHDDRVIAAALAVEMWSSQALPVLDGLPMAPDPLAPADMPAAHQRAVAGYFRRIGLR